MTMLMKDRDREDRLIAERQSSGADRFDEVWDGAYLMSPLANNEHHSLVGDLFLILKLTVGLTGRGIVQPGANVSDRADDWTRNYRVPDVVVYLSENPAENRDTHWLGGPDLAVEISSEGERVLEKLDFYAKVGTRELLVVHRSPWSLELYRLGNGGLELAERSCPEDPHNISSAVVPLRFRFQPGNPRPGIVVEHADALQRWVV